MSVQPRLSADSPNDEVLVSIHIPKTAGSTLNWLLWRLYTPWPFLPFRKSRPFLTASIRNDAEYRQFIQRMDNMPETERRKIKALHGHIKFRYDIQPYFERPCRFITFLRDPVSRVVSDYQFALRTGMMPDVVSLEGFAGFGFNRNIQTRWLLSSAAVEDLAPEEMLQDAIGNLEQHFDFVGLTERFDESLLMLKHMLGWKTPYYLNYNVNQNPIPLSSLSAQTIDIIKSNNELDLKLYAYAQERFNSCLEQHGYDITQQLNRFRRINTLVRPLYLYPLALGIQLKQAIGRSPQTPSNPRN